ncbi:hypothetical protein O181_050289 [Austropuccinia psidii MF-1]|uniref:Uncharacterized protein n=1 Tax=Austropuccinia psidii MF-1 TaxID=1389203 RepID=A0A9Q3DWG4_9BASI|nr:hypothetical protein [Austropuccinia psidii MF-1]
MVELPSFTSLKWDFVVIDTPKGEDLKLGFDLLNHFNPSINLRKGLIIFNVDHKDYYDPSKSSSNDVSSSKSCETLVCLPPSSYHDSLEELWHEEEEPEEIETMINVVPSAYHHYAYGFSKVTAEKRLPHHAYDNHIKREGFLPPAGVIYSLSNQESDRLIA